MNPSLQLVPEQASSTAVHLDHLTLYLFIVAAIFSTLIFALIFFFAVKYRRRKMQTQYASRPTEVRLENLTHVHARRHA